MIEPVSKTSLAEVLPLIKLYQISMGSNDIPNQRNADFFAQFGELSPFGCQFSYKKNNEIVGLSTIYFSFTSTKAQKMAILKDLYVLPNYRNQGIGRALIEHCYVYAQEKGVTTMQWNVDPENTVANKLCQSLNIKAIAWKFYTYDI